MTTETQAWPYPVFVEITQSVMNESSIPDNTGIMERRNIDRGGELISLLLPGLARLELLIREAKHIMTPICSIYGAFRGFCETKLSHPVLRVASDTCVDTQ